MGTETAHAAFSRQTCVCVGIHLACAWVADSSVCGKNLLAEPKSKCRGGLHDQVVNPQCPLALPFMLLWVSCISVAADEAGICRMVRFNKLLSAVMSIRFPGWANMTGCGKKCGTRGALVFLIHYFPDDKRELRRLPRACARRLDAVFHLVGAQVVSRSLVSRLFSIRLVCKTAYLNKHVLPA